MKKSSREIIISILLNIEAGSLLNNELNNNVYKNDKLTTKEKNFINKTVRGVLEYKLSLDEIIRESSNIKFSKIKNFIKILLEVAIYEIKLLNSSKDYAVVNEYVNIIKKTKFKNLSGFVNAILRNISSSNFAISKSYPKWIIELVVKDYGVDTANKVLYSEVDNGLWFRIRDKNIIDNIADKFDIIKSKDIDNAIFIKDIKQLDTVEEFINGNLIIQDISSIKVGNIISDICKNLNKRIKILDLCAAPGGKSIHASENNADIVACDISQKKLDKIKENIDRLNINNVTLILNDAIKFNKYFVKKFDIVICDLPCSGLGLMNKKPDIRYRLKEEDINELSNIQRSILENAIKYVSDNGYLIFSTCTIAKGENIKNFNFLCNNLKNIAINRHKYIQYLQGIDQGDGFFISVFKNE